MLLVLSCMFYDYSMSYRFYNPNPLHKRTTDCVIRALSKALHMDWEQVYVNAAMQGFDFAEMPNTGHVWRALLRRMGFRSYAIPDTCPDCYTVEDFAKDHTEGTFVLAIGGVINHVVCVENGDWYDTFDCGDEIPFFYMRKE